MHALWKGWACTTSREDLKAKLLQLERGQVAEHWGETGTWAWGQGEGVGAGRGREGRARRGAGTPGLPGRWIPGQAPGPQADSGSEQSQGRLPPWAVCGQEKGLPIRPAKMGSLIQQHTGRGRGRGMGSQSWARAGCGSLLDIFLEIPKTWGKSETILHFRL